MATLDNDFNNLSIPANALPTHHAAPAAPAEAANPARLVHAYNHNNKTSLYLDGTAQYREVLKSNLAKLKAWAAHHTLDSATQQVATAAEVADYPLQELSKLVEKALWGRGGLISGAEQSLAGTNGHRKGAVARKKLTPVAGAPRGVFRDEQGGWVCRGAFVYRDDAHRDSLRSSLIARDVGDADGFTKQLRTVKAVIREGLRLDRYERVVATDWDAFDPAKAAS